MTLLIADDEDLIRFTIKDMIRDCGIQFEKILEASTGSELISLCRKHRPEIALVDIRMPGKSGLEAIEELQDLPTQWIILTGYADFGYAQQALRLGADDYLLKPPSPEEISKTLAAAVKCRTESRRESAGDFERRILAVFNNTSSPSYDPLFSERGLWSGWVLCLDSSLSQKDALQVQTGYSRKIRESYFTRLPARCRGALTTLEDGKLLVSLFKQMPGECVVEELPAPADKKGLRFCRIAVDEADSFKSYLQGLDRLRPLLPLRFLSCEEELPGRESHSGKQLSFCRKLEDMIVSAGASRKEEMDINLGELLELDISFSEGQDRALVDNLRGIFPEQERQAGYRAILEGLRGSESSEKGDSQSVLVQQALRIVRDRFHEDIGIAQIAATLQVTPNYLSSLFRKHTGILFTRYITELRINRARQLLKETSLNISEIAAEVGYHSSRHFSGLFRQETGMSPTEYIKRYRI